MRKKAIKKILEYENKYTYCNCFQTNIGTTGLTGGTVGPTGPTGATNPV